MTKDEALKLALEAFGEIDWSNNSQWQSDRAKVAIATLKKALANEALEKMAENARELGLDYEPAQEPCCYGGIAHDCHAGEGCRIVNRIKATPPQRTWVRLTDVDIQQMGLKNYIKVVRETEAKLKELNS
jgi:hypothetical protein